MNQAVRVLRPRPDRAESWKHAPNNHLNGDNNHLNRGHVYFWSTYVRMRAADGGSSMMDEPIGDTFNFLRPCLHHNLLENFWFMV